MFHNTTMLLVVIGTFLVLPIVVWMTLSHHRNKAVQYWCAGSLMAALGLLLLVLRPLLPWWLTFHAANASLMFVFVLWAHGMRLLRRAGLSDWTLALAFVVGLCLYSVLYAWTPINVRGFGVRLLLSVLAIWVAVESWHCARQLQAANAYPIVVAMGIFSAVMLIQLAIADEVGTAPNLFGNTWSALALVGAALLVSFVTHFSFVGMIIELAVRKELKDRSEAMSVQHAALLDSQLMNIDRQRRMILVSGAMAHELNQPLTVALTNAQLMQRIVDSGKMVSDTMSELLKKMTLSIDRATSILQRIRDIQPKSDVVMESETHDLAALAQQALDQFQHDVQSQSIKVRFIAPEQPLWTDVDALSTSQILVNLIRNAIQAMQDQSEKTLLINCEGNAERIWIEISDTGPGLPGHIAQHWGMAFLTTREDGLGLGLAISRTLAQQMGGVLELRNRHQSFGAVAILSFARSSAASHPNKSDGELNA